MFACICRTSPVYAYGAVLFAYAMFQVLFHVSTAHAREHSSILY